MSNSSRQDPDRNLDRYLEFFGRNFPGFLTFWTKRTASHTSFRTDQLSSAAAFALATSAAGDDVYVRANVQAVERNAKVDGVAALTVLTLDFDVKGPSHKAENLPSSPDELAGLLAEVGAPAPTVVLSTGGGLLGLWSIQTPLIITTPMELKGARDLSRNFQRAIIEAAKARGLHIDNTSDLVRACRLPGTRNWKPEYGSDGAAVTVREWSGEAVALESLRAVADRVTATGRSKPVDQALRVKGRAEGHSRDVEPSWDAVLLGCDALRSWAGVSDGLPEPIWYAMASIAGRCSDGRDRFHEVSCGDQRYDRVETDAKLDHAIDAAGPRTCEGLEGLGGDCSRCPFHGLVNSPIALGYAREPVIASLARQWAYVAEKDAFVDLHALEVDQ